MKSIQRIYTIQNNLESVDFVDLVEALCDRLGFSAEYDEESVQLSRVGGPIITIDMDEATLDVQYLKSENLHYEQIILEVLAAKDLNCNAMDWADKPENIKSNIKIVQTQVEAMENALKRGTWIDGKAMNQNERDFVRTTIAGAQEVIKKYEEKLKQDQQ